MQNVQGAKISTSRAPHPLTVSFQVETAEKMVVIKSSKRRATTP